MIVAASDQARSVVVRMVTEGSMPAGMMWVGLRGAAAFVGAIARGDVATAEVHAERDAECLRCPARTEVRDGAGCVRPGFVGYCGEAMVERMDGPIEGRSCGCLLDAANAVANHGCPRGRFVAVRVGGREIAAGAGV